MNNKLMNQNNKLILVKLMINHKYNNKIIIVNN